MLCDSNLLHIVYLMLLLLFNYSDKITTVKPIANYFKETAMQYYYRIG